jgi:hypothetical protein
LKKKTKAAKSKDNSAAELTDSEPPAAMMAVLASPLGYGPPTATATVSAIPGYSLPTATPAVPATYSATNQVLDAQYALHNRFILDSGSTVHVCSNINRFADGFTKPLSYQKHQAFLKQLNLVDIQDKIIRD